MATTTTFHMSLDQNTDVNNVHQTTKQAESGHNIEEGDDSASGLSPSLQTCLS